MVKKYGVLKQVMAFGLPFYFGSEWYYIGSMDDNFYALDASTGAEIWNF